MPWNFVINTRDKIKRYYRFSSAEVSGLVITILVFAFMISFNEWGKGNEFDFGYGLFNFFNAILIVALTMLFRESAVRIAALGSGYKAEFKMWSLGLVIGVVFVLLSNGKVWWIILPGSVFVTALAGHRLGFWFYDLSLYAVGMIAITGSVSNIALAAILKIINSFVMSPLINKAIIFNLAMAVWSAIPIPPLDGGKAFRATRLGYAYIFSFILLSALLLFLDIPAWAAIIVAALLAVVCWLVYYIFFEANYWRF